MIVWDEGKVYIQEWFMLDQFSPIVWNLNHLWIWSKFTSPNIKDTQTTKRSSMPIMTYVFDIDFIFSYRFTVNRPGRCLWFLILFDFSLNNFVHWNLWCIVMIQSIILAATLCFFNFLYQQVFNWVLHRVWVLLTYFSCLVFLLHSLADKFTWISRAREDCHSSL